MVTVYDVFDSYTTSNIKFDYYSTTTTATDAAAAVVAATSSLLNKSDYTDPLVGRSVVFYSNAFPPVFFDWHAATVDQRRRARQSRPAHARSWWGAESGRGSARTVTKRRSVWTRYTHDRTASTLADLGSVNGCTSFTFRII